MKIKILGIVGVLLLILNFIPLTSGLVILQEQEIQSKIESRGDYIQTMFIFGRIQQLQSTEEGISFIPSNVYLFMKQKSPEMAVTYVGHVRSADQRMYFSQETTFKGFLSLKIICGIFRFQYHTPEAPSIIFHMDTEARILTVMSVDSSEVLWTDLQNVGDGSCTIPTEGYIDAGEQITDCYGTISLVYIPSQTLIATFTFP